jgi:hypothetical protein
VKNERTEFRIQNPESRRETKDPGTHSATDETRMQENCIHQEVRKEGNQEANQNLNRRELRQLASRRRERSRMFTTEIQRHKDSRISGRGMFGRRIGPRWGKKTEPQRCREGNTGWPQKNTGNKMDQKFCRRGTSGVEKGVLEGGWSGFWRKTVVLNYTYLYEFTAFYTEYLNNVNVTN